MEKTIFDIMSDDPATVTKFIDCCDKMLDSQYILADGRIQSVLKAIATSKILYSLFDNILVDFDYQSVANACIASNGTSVNLPSSNTDIAALVFCLLVDIDKHTIVLKDFLEFYRNTSDFAFAYKHFLNDFIAPFKNAVISILESKKIEKQSAEKNHQALSLHMQRQANFDKFMGAFIARIASNVNLSAVIKDKLIVLCDSFSDAVKAEDLVNAKTIYKNLVSCLRINIPVLAKELENFDINA